MIVVDAAAVVDALTAPDGTELLRERLSADELHAPSLLDFEIVSALRGAHPGRAPQRRARARRPRRLR